MKYAFHVLIFILFFYPARLISQVVKRHGQLAVVGTQLFDKHKKPIILRA
jgi:hypothetical protein